MDIKVVKNEKLKSTNRAKEMHFIEIKVNKLENVDENLADKFIRDIVGINFNLDFTNETWNDIKEIIVDKLNKITSFPKGFLKNDGTIIPLIANYVIEEVFGIELLSYSEDLTDIEIVPKGFDSLFLNKDLSIFLCEYKSSISKLNEEKIAEYFINGYKSIFCKDSSVISKISTIKSRLAKEQKDNREIIKNNLNLLVKNRRTLENIVDSDFTKFNICCITKSSVKIDTIKIINKMHDLFIENIFCLNEKKKYCKKYKECDKIKKLKVINLIVIRIPDDFDIKSFYQNIIKKIEGKISE